MTIFPSKVRIYHWNEDLESCVRFGEAKPPRTIVHSLAPKLLG